MTATTKTLDTLTAELWDFLGLGPDLDLPELESVSLKRDAHVGGWECTAYTQQKDAAAAIEAVHAYAAYAGGRIEMHTPYRSAVQPSGWQMSLWTHVVVAEVRIKVLAILDADEYAEAMAEEAPGGYCCWESFQAQGPCDDCAGIAGACGTVDLGSIIALSDAR